MRRHPLGIELRHSVLLVAVPFLVAIGVFMASERLPRTEGTWPSVVTSVGDTLVVLGPIVAGLSAWLGARESRRHLEYLRQTSAHAPGTVLRVPMVAAAVSAFLAVFLVVALSIGGGIIEGLVGAPPALWVLRTFVAALVFVPLPYYVGHARPAAWTPPLVAVLAYVSLGVVEVYLSDFGLLYALSPLPGTSGTVWFELNRPVLVGQTLWLAGQTVLVVAVATLLINRGVRWPQLTRWRATAMVAGATCVLGVVLVAWNGSLPYSDRPAAYEPVCGGAASEVCVHPAYAAALPELATIADLLAARLAGTPAEFHQMQQAFAGGGSPLGGNAIVTFSIAGSGAGSSSTALDQLVGQSFLPACTQAYDDQSEAAALQQLVVGWLSYPNATGFTVDLGGLEPPDPVAIAANQFTAMTEAQRRGWLRTNYPAFATCSLNDSMFSAPVR